MIKGNIVEKPRCRLCESEDLPSEMVAELLYSLFNPYHRKTAKVNANEYIKKFINDEELIKNYEKLDTIFREMINNFGYSNSSWINQIDEYQTARENAWNQIKKDINNGIIDEKDLSPDDLLENLGDEILEDLIKEGYIDGYERRRYRKIISFNEKAEKIIGEKIVNLALEDLPLKHPGEEPANKRGITPFSSHKITEYDSFVHFFDNIDISESLINCAKRNDFSFDERDIVAREPKHLEKVHYVMLIDVSDSMRGKKFIGAIESAIGLREVIKRKDSRELNIIAFNHRVKEIKRGEILNLFPQGRTDIGLALRKARDIIKKKEGTAIVFLITDGEPTSSFNPYLSPGMCAVRESRQLRDIARLSIIMLGKDNNFRRICEKMASACGNSKIFYFSNPLDLKNYFIRTYGLRG